MSVYRRYTAAELKYRGMRDFMERAAGRVCPNRDSKKARAQLYTKVELYREAVSALERALDWFDTELSNEYCTDWEYVQLVHGASEGFNQYVRKYC